MEDLVLSTEFRTNSPEIEIVIATVDEKDQKPRNWRLNNCDEPKNSTGGCSMRIFAGSDVYFDGYGPDITLGKIEDYKHAVTATKLIADRLAKMNQQRGYCVDPAEFTGRWLEAAGVDVVMMRPPNARDNGWLSDGDWRKMTVGETVNLVRTKLPKPEALGAC